MWANSKARGAAAAAIELAARLALAGALLVGASLIGAELRLCPLPASLSLRMVAAAECGQATEMAELHVPQVRGFASRTPFTVHTPCTHRGCTVCRPLLTGALPSVCRRLKSRAQRRPREQMCSPVNFLPLHPEARSCIASAGERRAVEVAVSVSVRCGSCQWRRVSSAFFC